MWLGEERVIADRREVLKGFLLLPGSFMATVFTPAELHAAAERLKKAEYFAFGGVGYAGVTSRGELDYRTLIAQPSEQACRSFEVVFSDGNNAAKCCALAGLHHLLSPQFQRLFDRVSGSQEKVETMQGCIMDTNALGVVAKSIRDGRYPAAQPKARFDLNH